MRRRRGGALTWAIFRFPWQSTIPTSPVASLKATLVGGVLPQGAAIGISATPKGGPDLRPLDVVDVDGTLGMPETALLAGPVSQGASSAGRTTVLPRRTNAGGEHPVTAAEQRARFDRVRTLGQGAMGQVELARDNDIRRTVAVKRVLGEAATDAALLRFADEVRIVGQLEHPGIVPDLRRGPRRGRTSLHRHEAPPRRDHGGHPLQAPRGRPRLPRAFHRRLPCASVFGRARRRSLRARPRHLAPRSQAANVQIGPYGEVTVMDWGIAKPFRRADGPRAASHSSERLVESHDQRLLETQDGRARRHSALHVARASRGTQRRPRRPE